MTVSISEHQGYVIQSTNGSIRYAVDKFRANKRIVYQRKKDRKSGIADNEISVSEINGFLVKSSESDYEAFVPTMAEAKAKAKNIEEKEAKKERVIDSYSPKIYGERLRKSREDLCCMNQGKAAQLIGISQKKLCVYEHCTDGVIPDITVIIKAAKIYNVSADYLLGLTDDFETDINIRNEREIGAWIYEQLEHDKVSQMNVMRTIHNKILTIGNAINEAVADSVEIKNALDKVRERNSGIDGNISFDDDVKSGATLVRVVDEFMLKTDSIKSQLKRFNCFNEAAKKTTGVNIDMFKVDNAGWI